MIDECEDKTCGHTCCMNLTEEEHEFARDYSHTESMNDFMDFVRYSSPPEKWKELFFLLRVAVEDFDAAVFDMVHHG